MGLLGRAAAGPVFLHVGTTFVEPTVVGYEPTEGCTTDPYPSVPGICASASVLVRVNAVASAIVVTFMMVSFALRESTSALSARPFRSILLQHDRSGQAVHISQSLDAPGIGLYRVSFDIYTVGFC